MTYPTAASISIRPMQLGDLTTVLFIQALCYAESIVEPEQSLRAKLQASPACWRRYAFQAVVPTSSLKIKLVSYGADIAYMQRSLRPQ